MYVTVPSGETIPDEPEGSGLKEAGQERSSINIFAARMKIIIFSLVG
jgi:hypothetical protein